MSSSRQAFLQLTCGDLHPIRLRAESLSLSSVICVFIISISLGTGNGYNNRLSVGYTSAQAATSGLQVGPIRSTNNKHYLCLADDYTNDLPVFIQRQTICNVESVPVDVYEIKYISPQVDPKKPGPNYVYQPCIVGDLAGAFLIDDSEKLKLTSRLNQTETILKLQIIRVADANDIAGTPGELRQAINAIQFNLVIDDCNRVSWQTVAVAILSSVCVVLLSTIAIMLILYQQKGLIMTSKDDGDEYESSTGGNMGRSPHQLDRPSHHSNDESFINPRRTSSYDFSAIAKAHHDAISESQIIETGNL